MTPAPEPFPVALARVHALAFTDQRPWDAAEFAALLAQPNVWLFGDSTSFILARIIAGEAEILTLATDPAWQRQGLARRNLQNFLDILPDHQVTQAFLEVAITNLPARALYASAGFEQVGQRRNYYHLTNGSYVDAVVMAWTLPTDKKPTEQ